MTAQDALRSTREGELIMRPIVSAYVSRHVLERVNLWSADASDTIEKALPHRMLFRGRRGFQPVQALTFQDVGID